MKIALQTIYKYFTLFIIGGILYYSMEVIWKSSSHVSMFLLGGIIFLFCGIQNEFFSGRYPVYKQIFLCLAFTLSGEFITGLIVNVWLNLNVWDYSHLPLNLFGQVCVPYAMVFTPLCYLGIMLNILLRYYIF